MKASHRALGVLLWLAAGPCPVPAGAEEARRIVAAGGALTEIVCALGMAGRLAGVDTTSRFPAETETLPQIGYLRSLGAEGILSLHPDLVLAAAEAGPPAVLEQVRSAGTRVETVAAPPTPEGVAQKIAAVAGALGAPERGQALADRYREEWRAARAAVADYRDRPRVLFVLAHAGGSPLVAGRNTAADAVMALAGAENAGTGFEGYKPLSAEAVLAANPEVLLVTAEGVGTLGGLAALWDHPALRLTPAGRARRAVVMDSLYLLGFGPRLPRAVRELARRLRETEAG
jgi:iron complex transport system substrate-binding protein